MIENDEENAKIEQQDFYQIENKFYYRTWYWNNGSKNDKSNSNDTKKDYI